MEPALAGTRVLACEIWQQGPSATGLLADYGAEVIKIEPPGGGDPGRGMKRIWGVSVDLGGGLNAYFETINRNKKSITLNLRHPKGQEAFYKLAKEADVIIESFRPGVMQRLKIDYPTIKEINPGIVYCSISAYGMPPITLNI